MKASCWKRKKNWTRANSTAVCLFFSFPPPKNWSGEAFFAADLRQFSLGYPERLFHNFRGSKSVDRRFWTTYTLTWIDIFWCWNIVKRSVRTPEPDNPYERIPRFSNLFLPTEYLTIWEPQKQPIDVFELHIKFEHLFLLKIWGMLGRALPYSLSPKTLLI